jgi:aminotransferase
MSQITGWRVGYVIAPCGLMSAIRKVHDYMVVAAPTPFQMAAVAVKNHANGALNPLAQYQKETTNPEESQFEMIRKLEKFEPDRIMVLTFYPRFFKKFDFKRVSKRKLYPKIYSGCINCVKYLSPLACPEVAMVRMVFDKETEVQK